MGKHFGQIILNIDEYSPSNHPDDFHLLALTVYKDESEDIDTFAEKLHYDVSGNIEFVANDIIGKEFVSAGLIKGNPRIAIIFKNNDLFFVFNLGFVDGDANVVAEMEDIIKTFKITK